MASSESAGYTITDPDEQPFSPSVFLNLPPTPPHHDGQEQEQEPSNLSDHLVLPFISHILMADDDDKQLSYQYPDPQALLRAQHPFAEILSNTTNTNVATNNYFTTISPFFPNNDAMSMYGTTTWPTYNAIRRIRRGDHASITTFLAEQDSNADKANNTDKTATQGGAGAGVGEHNSSLFFSSGQQMTQIKVTMDMLNQAFLKGMEEASKFLPTTNIILPIHSEAISGSTDRRHRIIAAAGQVKKKGVVVDGIMSSMLQASGSDSIAHKKYLNSWDNLEVKMDGKMVDLSIAVIAAESDDETGEKVADKFILIKYQSLLDKMMGMSIAMDMEANKNARKGKRKSVVTLSDEPTAVDLRALLMQCAHAVATGDRLDATELLCKIKQHSSPLGDATQRLAHCFAHALEVRLDGMGSDLYKSLMLKLTPDNELHFLKAYQFCVPISCFKMMAFMFSNLTILKAITGRRRKVHIVDYGEHFGLQWPTLLGNWATWEEGPPEVRITSIVLPGSGFRPAARIQETGRRLNNFARQCGIPFKFRSIVAKWETVCADDLNIEPDEVLIVNGLADFGRLMDESIHGIDNPSPRDMVLKNIREMRPDVFILFIENSSYNTPFFLTRFREALFFHSAVFDMMDAVAPRDNKDRILFEQNLLGRHAFNVIACEGRDRVVRPETYKKWKVRNCRAGLRQLPLDPDIVKAVSKEVRHDYSRQFVIDVDQQWFLLGWKGRILYAMSTWVANDAISSLASDTRDLSAMKKNNTIMPLY